MKNTKETVLRKGVIEGDTNIIKAFYKKNHTCITKYILSNSGNEQDVADVCQDAMVIVYQKLTNGMHIDYPIEAYYYGVCKKVWQNRLLKKKRIVYNDFLIQTTQEKDETCILDEIEEKERGYVFQKYVMDLNESSKKLLELFCEGNSMKQIGKVLGFTEGYTRKKKYKIKKQLLQMLKNDSIYQELVN